MKLLSAQNSMLMLERTHGEMWSAHCHRVPHHLSHFLLLGLLPPACARSALFPISSIRAERISTDTYTQVILEITNSEKHSFTSYKQMFTYVRKRHNVQKQMPILQCLGYEFHILVCRELLPFLGKAICWDVLSCLQLCLRSIEWSATPRSNYGPECHTGYGIVMQWNQ